MPQPKRNFSYGFIAILILFAALSRLIPHPPNFAPMGAMALFGAAYFKKKHLALLVPLIALWISSLIIDNTIAAQYYDGFQWFTNPFVYLGMIAIVGLGWLTLRRPNVQSVLASALGASIVFFLISNFGVWLQWVPEKNFATLSATFAAGVPFFHWTLLSDVFYCAVLFGAYEMAADRGWVLRPSQV